MNLVVVNPNVEVNSVGSSRLVREEGVRKSEKNGERRAMGIEQSA